MDDVDTLGGNGGKLFDLSNPEAVDWMIELMSSFIEKYNIDIYRQDFNIYPDFFWNEKDEPDRIGITEIKYMEGEYRLLDTLLKRFPNLMIDNCSSGGNRLDLESCMRCVFCWRSDTGSFKDKAGEIGWSQTQTQALSNYIVYHATAAWDPKAYVVRSALTNGFAANFDIFAEGFDFENVQKVLAECQRLRKYYEGDFYALTEIDLKEDHWSAHQFGTKDSGVMMIFRREQDQQEEQTVAFQGLDLESEYLLKISDEEYRLEEKTVSGKELAEGYTFCLKTPRSSFAVEYIKK